MFQNIKLSNRLQICADLITTGVKIADIGTDHAYIPIWLAGNGKVSHALACDVNPEPLLIAQNNIMKYSLERIISTRLSNGLKNVNQGEADEIIIAGMGGELIAKILAECTWENKLSKKFVLQPMTSEYELRLYLSENGYKIEKEIAVICAGKVYTIMLVVFTGAVKSLKNIHLYIGKLNENMDEATATYIQKQIKNLKNQKMGAEIRGFKEKSIEYGEIIDELEAILKKGL